MTILFGILCQDGVVVGADGSATFATAQFSTIEQPTEKIDIHDNRVIVAGTGEIGLGQRFNAVVADAFKSPNFLKLTPVNMMTELSHHALKNFQRTFVPDHVPYGALLAFFSAGQPQLCEFQYGNMRPEFKTNRLWYVSMGGGQHIGDPFLGLMRKVFWESGPPSRQDAIFSVVWALRHAIECNPGGINEPIRIAVLTADNSGKPQARLLDENELQEHRENVDEAIKHLRAYRSKLKGDDSGQVPEVPKP